MLTNRKKQAQVTRQEILDAAEEVFYEMGLSAATLATIAERSSVTRGAIYWHFSNKADVFEAVFQRTILYYEELIADVANNAASLKEFENFIVELIHDIVSDSMKQRALCILLLRHEWLPFEKQILNEAREAFIRQRDVIDAFFARMQEANGLCDSHSSRTLADVFLFYFHGMVTQFLRNPETIDLAKHAKDYMHLLFRALETPTHIKGCSYEK